MDVPSLAEREYPLFARRLRHRRQLGTLRLVGRQLLWAALEYLLSKSDRAREHVHELGSEGGEGFSVAAEA
tara:strand:- start:4058 stop:4270 length:213 start_codon:yes stop_codon:yes gene_type:complete